MGTMSLFKAFLEFILRLFRRKPVELPSPAPTPLPIEELPVENDFVEAEDTPATMVPGIGKEDIDMNRPTLERGSTNTEAVRDLQTLLNKNGEKLTADGDFGPGTERAVKNFQASYGFPVSGKVDPELWAILDRVPFGSDVAYQGIPLKPAEKIEGSNSGTAKAWNAYGNLLTTLADVLGLTPSVACAVLAVESAGEGFWDGRMVIRFENHIFYRWGKSHRDVFNTHFRMDSDERWKGHEWREAGHWRPLHTKAAGQDEEYAVLKFARALDDEAALQSISMGAPQIMGFNAEKVGFKAAREMFDAFSTDERAHVLGLFDFITSDHRMVNSLRASSWEGFARIYNGSGQAAHYGDMIGEAVQKAKSLGIV